MASIDPLRRVAHRSNHRDGRLHPSSRSGIRHAMKRPLAALLSAGLLAAAPLAEAQYGGPAAAPPLLHQHVLAALGKIGDTRSTRPILDFLAQDSNAETRGTAVYTLGEIGDISVRDDLKTLRDRERDPRVQQIADEALAKL